ncbi:MAG TPA: ATP-binding protein, partial [Draconibacterium sp.]|nr:ATP-binding protein [Draconibacterium sp.]
MLLLYRSTSGVKSTAFWAFGSLTVGVGLLFRLIPPTGGFVATVIPTLFIALGLYYYLAGIWHLKGKKINPWIVFGMPALNLVQSVVFSQLIPSDQIRLILYYSIIVIYACIALFEMLKLNDNQKYLRQIFNLNAFSFFIFLALLISGITVLVSQPGFNPVNAGRATLIMFTVSNLLMVALTFGFISAVNLKLYKELEVQLKTKDKFFSIIAHDLRGPVGTIMNFLNVLNNENELTKEEREYYLRELEKLSQSTFHLLQNLFDWSRSETHEESEIIELNKVIAQNLILFERLAKFKSITVEFDKGSASCIHGDSKMIEVVLRNLVSNALKFTPEGGKVTIKTSKNLNKVELFVRDTGIGISPEKLKTIYNFEGCRSSVGTNGEVGSGFGMVVCKDFVQKNKGSIRIKSEINVGTEVIVEFPLSELNGEKQFQLN